MHFTRNIQNSDSALQWFKVCVAECHFCQNRHKSCNLYCFYVKWHNTRDCWWFLKRNPTAVSEGMWLLRWELVAVTIVRGKSRVRNKNGPRSGFISQRNITTVLLGDDANIYLLFLCHGGMLKYLSMEERNASGMLRVLTFHWQQGATESSVKCL